MVSINCSIHLFLHPENFVFIIFIQILLSLQAEYSTFPMSFILVIIH